MATVIPAASSERIAVASAARSWNRSVAPRGFLTASPVTLIVKHGDEEGMVRFFAELGPFEAVVEATASYEWFARLVEPYAARLVLAHPGKLRVIAESTRKSDKLDARALAEFLALVIARHHPAEPGGDLRVFLGLAGIERDQVRIIAVGTQAALGDRPG